MREFMIVAALTGACATTSACGQNGNSSQVVSRSYKVGDFQQIEVAGPFDVNVRTGSNAGVSARGPEDLLNRTVVEIRGDKLLIRPRSNDGFFNWGSGWSQKAVVTVTVPQLRAANLAGAGNLNVDALRGDHFEATLAGSGDLGIGSINLHSLKVSLAGSGGAKVGSGQVQAAEYNIVGAGDVNAAEATSQQLRVSVAGSGGVLAHATGTAEVKIAGSGDVTVTGGAKCTVSKSGPGHVRCT